MHVHTCADAELPDSLPSSTLRGKLQGTMTMITAEGCCQSADKRMLPWHGSSLCHAVILPTPLHLTLLNHADRRLRG